MNSKMLMEVSEYLKAQANVMAAVEQLVPPKESTETKPTNIFGYVDEPKAAEASTWVSWLEAA